MAEKTIYIKFDGYWRDVNKSGIPKESGVYCVYTCEYDTNKKIVNIIKLVYIGESVNVNTRIKDHEKHKEWVKHLKSGQVLCYSMGPVGSVDRERGEAALINKHKPPENTEYVNSFPFDTTIMSLSGKTALLTDYFKVNRR